MTQTTTELFQCPRCQGMGDIASHSDREQKDDRGQWKRVTRYSPCNVCGETGELTQEQCDAYHDSMREP